MSRLILTIDQTPCRASYGLLGPAALRRDLVATQRNAVRENIARYVERGDRMAKIAGDENSVAAIASESYFEKAPPEVIVVPVARPVFSVREVGGALDIVI